MVGRSKRKIVLNSGGSYLMSLPKEWAKELPDNIVHVVFDDILWVFPSDREEDVHRIVEKIMEKVTGVRV